MYVTEPSQQIEVLDSVDVLVCGAGVSGCAAALAAARAGARTALVERNGVLGGVATAGLMANIGNLYLDGAGRSVIHGIAREVIDRLVARGGASPRWASREVPGCVIDAEQLKVVLAEMQREAGVEVLTHVWVARPLQDGRRIRGALLETKVGRRALIARTVVDTTGEADLAYGAGCPLRWTEGSASLEFKMARVDLDALYEHFRRHPETFPVGMDMVAGFPEFERNWVERGIFFFPHGGGRKWDLFERAIAEGAFQTERGQLWSLNAAGLYGLRGMDSVIVNSNFWRVTTLEPGPVSAAELACQEACYYVADFFRQHIPGFEQAYVVQMATDLGIRHTRGIVGEETLMQADTTGSEPFRSPDVVGCVPAHADFAQTGRFFQGHTFDVPYGILVPLEVEGLLVGSGKSVSCDPQSLVRGMSSCMLLGQAAGAAAALSARRDVPPRHLDVSALQRELLVQGVYLGDETRLAELGLD